MNEYFIISFPGVKGGWWFCGYKSIPFDASTTGIISSDDDLPSEEVITKPHFVFGEEPVRVVGDVQLSIGAARRG